MTLRSGEYKTLNAAIQKIASKIFSRRYNDLIGKPTEVAKTSDLLNDGSDASSSYVENDEIGAVANSNDYNDLDNLPVLGGGGDMLISTYDPTAVSGDAFDMDNMAEGTNKILSSAERTILSNTSGTNTGDQSLAGYQLEPSEGAFVNGDKSKLDGIEALADVTDATNVAAAGAVMTETDPVFTAWDKDYDDLTNKPTIPADISDLTDTGGELRGIRLFVIDDGDPVPADAQTGDVVFELPV